MESARMVKRRQEIAETEAEVNEEVARHVLVVFVVPMLFALLGAIALAVLKLTGYIDCPWVWVSSPMCAVFLSTLFGGVVLAFAESAGESGIHVDFYGKDPHTQTML